MTGVPLFRQRPPPGLDSPSPQLVGPCIAGVPLPTAPRRGGIALQELHCPRPLGGVAVHCRSCTAPLPRGSGAVRCRNSNAHCPQAVWLCMTGVPLFRQRPPPGQDSPSPQLVGPCIAGVPLPTAPRRGGIALQELHCPRPPGGVSVHCRSCTAHYPEVVGQCVAGIPLPTAPRRCGCA